LGKLHEILAVEEDKKGKAKKLVQEAIKTFKDKQGHFVAQTTIFKPFSEDEEERLEGEQAMAVTVRSKLKYVTKAISDYFDVAYQKGLTNTHAKSDIVLEDGTVLAKDIPATGLLFLEQELKELRSLYDSIPTLEPTVPWEKTDPESKDAIRHYTQSRIRTKKVTKPVVLYEATKEHPAQVKEVSEDIQTGTVETRLSSSKLSPAQKSDILARLDNVISAVKKARMRANCEEVKPAKVGKVLFDYINQL